MQDLEITVVQYAADNTRAQTVLNTARTAELKCMINNRGGSAALVISPPNCQQLAIVTEPPHTKKGFYYERNLCLPLCRFSRLH